MRLKNISEPHIVWNLTTLRYELMILVIINKHIAKIDVHATIKLVFNTKMKGTYLIERSLLYL